MTSWLSPFKVTTLTTLVVNSSTVRVRFTSPGDDLDSNEPPMKYVIKVGHEVNSTNFEDSCCELVDENLFGSSTLDPINGGAVKDIYIRYKNYELNLCLIISHWM